MSIEKYSPSSTDVVRVLIDKLNDSNFRVKELKINNSDVDCELFNYIESYNLQGDKG